MKFFSGSSSSAVNSSHIFGALIVFFSSAHRPQSTPARVKHVQPVVFALRLHEHSMSTVDIDTEELATRWQQHRRAAAGSIVARAHSPPRHRQSRQTVPHDKRREHYRHAKNIVRVLAHRAAALRRRRSLPPPLLAAAASALAAAFAQTRSKTPSLFVLSLCLVA